MANLKSYSISNDTLEGLCNSSKLHVEILEASVISNFDGILIENDNISILGDSIINEASLDVVVSSHTPVSLSEYKHNKSNEIDYKTVELILLGYSYNGKTFSLSSNAQTNILALYSTKDNPALTYPIRYNTINDDDYYDLVDASDVEGMYLSALGTARARLDSGTVLKDQVRSASNKSEVDAIIDNR